MTDDRHPSLASPGRRSACLGLLLAAGLPAARALEAPAAEPVLTVSGRLHRPNRGADAVFDMAMLAALPQHDIVTRTPWHSGDPRRFTGPLMRDVLKAAGAGEPALLRAVALNDYRVEIPATDPQAFDMIVARLLDGKPMAVRDKGPLFVMYPFDAQPELRTAVFFSRCIWQLRAIEVA